MEAARAAPQAGDVQASAQLMRLEAGTYCIFHAAVPAGAGFAPLSGMRVTVPPGMDAVRVSTFDADGWMGAKGGAALVRMPDDGGQCWSLPIAIRRVTGRPCRDCRWSGCPGRR